MKMHNQGQVMLYSDTLSCSFAKNSVDTINAVAIKKNPVIIDQARTPGGSKAPKTPSGGDRFIPNRSATQFELGHFKITTDSASGGETDNLLSPSQKEYQKVMSENLNGTDISSNKIISYKTKAPSAPEGTITVFTSKYKHI